ncbi:MAG TPA: hypothetical protein VG166_00150 [Caulobacteraceae bacterium]|jgi:uncharacterized protein YceK|nr:hypothetical protein [Caulobacteraceae bacterium]
MTALRLALAAAVVLAGCAKVGTLDRPAPLFGERAKAQYRAEKAAEAAAKVKPADATPEPLPPIPEGPEPPPVAPR